MNQRILDVTCGDRTIWFQKNEPHTTYCDIRREEWEGDFGKQGRPKHRHLVIDPDILCDFTDLPFDDGTFDLVVFDPPHVENLPESSWLRKSYGTLTKGWQKMLHDGFTECMRVLKVGGGADIQMVRHFNQHTRSHQCVWSRSAVWSQKRKENEHALDVLYEV